MEVFVSMNIDVSASLEMFEHVFILADGLLLWVVLQAHMAKGTLQLQNAWNPNLPPPSPDSFPDLK